MGEEAYAGVLAEHHRVIRDALSSHEGEEIDTQGDGFFAVFDSSRGCIRAVIEMQRALNASTWPEGHQVRVRMGVHAGEALETATGLVGFDIHRAARLGAVAHGGQIVLSSSAAELVRDFLPEGAYLQDLGFHRLKDLGQPEHVYQLNADGIQTDFPALRSLDNPALPNNLPVQLATFVGRESELSELRSLVENSRLVTLTGSGGSGKTRLGLQVAAELLDGSGEGVWLVELAPIADEDAVATTIAEVLGIARRPAESSLDSLLASLTSQRALIVLDNCEHLIGACAKVADAILRRCPHMYLMATSREPLGISGETIYRVPSMSLPDRGDEDDEANSRDSDAVALFVERARAQGIGFVLNSETAPLVGRICLRLDGMPLAIELAASRLRALSLANLVDRLDQRFRLLTGGSRNALPRQQTLLATVNWSYSLLTGPEQVLLQRLSVFVDGFDLEGAEGVCAGGDIDAFELTDLLASLVDKSLVVAEPADGALRYRLLETIRQFAAERLIESGEHGVEALRQAHCQYFLSVAEAAEPEINGGGREQVRWLRRLDSEQGNLRRALEHAASDPDASRGTDEVLRFGASLTRYWVPRHRREEIVDMLVPVLERPEARADPALRGAALVTAAMGMREFDFAFGQRLAEEAIEIAENVGEDDLLIKTAMVLCSLLYFAGLLERGLAYGEAAVDRARHLGDDTLLGPSLVFLLLCSDRIQPDRTEELMAEAVGCVERSGDQDLAAILYNNAGVYRLRQGDLKSSRLFLERSMEAHRAVGVSNSIPVINLGWVLREEGDPSAAGTAFERGLRESHRVGDTVDIAYAALGIACQASDAGDWRRSALLHGFADAVLGGVGEPWQHPEVTFRQRSLDTVSAHLAAAELAAALAEGHALDLKIGVDVALKRS